LSETLSSVWCFVQATTCGIAPKWFDSKQCSPCTLVGQGRNLGLHIQGYRYDF
jgi:hypothetical protein